MDDDSKVGKGGDAFDNVKDAEFPSVAGNHAVILPIEDALDLHTFSPKEIQPLVEEYLYQCQRREFREVRIIHGRGTGTQRNLVRSLLAKSPFVAAFKDAPPESGGWGATMVMLKTKEPG